MSRTAPNAARNATRFAVILAALAAAGCGVRGAPSPAPPLFGSTDRPPVVPQPYPRAGVLPDPFPETVACEPGPCERPATAVPAAAPVPAPAPAPAAAQTSAQD